MEPEQDRGRRLLCFGAHPDDCELKSAGLAALWTGAGGQARFVALTDGSAGHHQLAGEPLVRRRRAEAAAGARAAGADSVILDNADGMLMPTLENRLRVIREIRLFRPDVIVCPRTNDYHPDHRYTSQLVQDACYMVTVPAVVPGTPHLAANPVVAYLPDEFTRPYAFDPSIAVDVGPVLDKIIAMLHCHVSQFYEWLPYNVGNAPEVPSGDTERRAWLGGQVKARLRKQAERFRPALIATYGKERGGRVEYAEAFEGCEYGASLDEAAKRRLFPFCFEK